MSEVQVTRVVTSGTCSLDGGTSDVDNNVWVVGDDVECVIIDAAHDAGPIRDAVRHRRVTAVLLSHAHDNPIGAVEPLCAATGAAGPPRVARRVAAQPPRLKERIMSRLPNGGGARTGA